MRSRRKSSLIPPSTESEGALDLETFMDRLHAQDMIARCVYELFHSRGADPLLNVEEWSRAESQVLERYWLKKHAA